MIHDETGKERKGVKDQVLRKAHTDFERSVVYGLMREFVKKGPDFGRVCLCPLPSE